MSTNKNLNLTEFLILLISATHIVYVNTLYAGDPCNFPDKRVGVCIAIHECESVVNQLRKSKNFKDLVQCSFEKSTPIICCPDKVPTTVSTAPRGPNGNPGAILFEDGLVSATQNRFGAGTKADSACKNWHELAAPTLSFHIYGGKAANPGEFPHMAALGYTSTEAGLEYSFECCGSLIEKDYILTAAHCVYRTDRRPIIVRLGKTSLYSTDDSATDIGIENFIVHPEYRSNQQYHDVALLKLSSSVTFSENIRPACLNTNKLEIGSSVSLLATGWGKTERGIRSDELLKVNLKSMSIKECNDRYQELGPIITRKLPNGITEGQMCTFDSEQVKDTCQGDSGGPLQMLNEENQVSTIVAIISFGFDCASSVPSVNVRIFYYLEWIESIVWPDG